MDQVVPWARLVKVIAPHHPRAGNGRQPAPLGTMLCIYFLQQWFRLEDPAAEDALYDVESMCRVAGIALGDDAVPDETTILNLRRLLEHPFHVIKRLWDFATVRYRGLKKNTARVLALMALANLYRVRHRLLPHRASCVPETGNRVDTMNRSATNTQIDCRVTGSRRVGCRLALLEYLFEVFLTISLTARAE